MYQSLSLILSRAGLRLLTLDPLVYDKLNGTVDLGQAEHRVALALDSPTLLSRLHGIERQFPDRSALFTNFIEPLLHLAGHGLPDLLAHLRDAFHHMPRKLVMQHRLEMDGLELLK